MLVWILRLCRSTRRTKILTVNVMHGPSNPSWGFPFPSRPAAPSVVRNMNEFTMRSMLICSSAMTIRTHEKPSPPQAVLSISPKILGRALPQLKYPYKSGWRQWRVPGRTFSSKSFKILLKSSGSSGGKSIRQQYIFFNHSLQFTLGQLQLPGNNGRRKPGSTSGKTGILQLFKVYSQM